MVWVTTRRGQCPYRPWFAAAVGCLWAAQTMPSMGPGPARSITLKVARLRVQHAGDVAVRPEELPQPRAPSSECFCSPSFLRRMGSAQPCFYPLEIACGGGFAAFSADLGCAALACTQRCFRTSYRSCRQQKRRQAAETPAGISLGLTLGCCMYNTHGGPRLSGCCGVSIETPHNALTQGRATWCLAACRCYLSPRMRDSSVGSRPSPDSEILPQASLCCTWTKTTVSKWTWTNSFQVSRCCCPRLSLLGSGDSPLPAGAGAQPCERGLLSLGHCCARSSCSALGAGAWAAPGPASRGPLGTGSSGALGHHRGTRLQWDPTPSRLRRCGEIQHCPQAPPGCIPG